MVLSWFMWTTKVAIIADWFVLYTWHQVSLHIYPYESQKKAIYCSNKCIAYFFQMKDDQNNIALGKYKKGSNKYQCHCILMSWWPFTDRSVS